MLSPFLIRMKYYLLSKALKLDRFFDSAEEVDSYIWAKTGIRFFSVDFLKAHLEENISYTYFFRGIDIAIYKNTLHTNTNATIVEANSAQENNKEF